MTLPQSASFSTVVSSATVTGPDSSTKYQHTYILNTTNGNPAQFTAKLTMNTSEAYPCNTPVTVQFNL